MSIVNWFWGCASKTFTPMFGTVSIGSPISLECSGDEDVAFSRAETLGSACRLKQEVRQSCS